jgi:hypothetical protein
LTPRTQSVYNSGMKLPAESTGQPQAAAPEPEITYPIRKRCANCPKFFTIESARGKHKKFCGKKCRMEWFRFGAAWGPLKEKIEKLIVKSTKEAAGTILEKENLIAAMRAVGFIHRSQVKKLKPEHTREGIQGQLNALYHRCRALETALNEVRESLHEHKVDCDQYGNVHQKRS